LGLFDAGGEGTAFFGGVLPPDTKTPCGTGFARGLGDWILVVVCAGRGGVGCSSSDESDSDDSDESEVASEEELSFSSRN
jgi:hypothetical protein